MAGTTTTSSTFRFVNARSFFRFPKDFHQASARAARGRSAGTRSPFRIKHALGRTRVCCDRAPAKSRRHSRPDKLNLNPVDGELACSPSEPLISRKRSRLRKQRGAVLVRSKARQGKTPILLPLLKLKFRGCFRLCCGLRWVRLCGQLLVCDGGHSSNYLPAPSCASPPCRRATGRCICLSVTPPSDTRVPSSMTIPPRTSCHRARLNLTFRTSTINPPCDTSSKLCKPGLFGASPSFRDMVAYRWHLLPPCLG